MVVERVVIIVVVVVALEHDSERDVVGVKAAADVGGVGAARYEVEKLVVVCAGTPSYEQSMSSMNS